MTQRSMTTRIRSHQPRFIRLIASGMFAMQAAIVTTTMSELLLTTPGLSFSQTASAQTTRQNSAEQVYRRASQSVVFVEAVVGGNQVKTGSGVVVDEKGLIITNSHVIQNARRIIVETQDGQRLEAEVVANGSADCLDLAVLRVVARRKLPSLQMGSAGELRRGQAVFAIGHPRGVVPSSITQGIVSNLFPDPGLIHFDATIIPGNSGGALLNSQGQLIGINTLRDEGIGTAISVEKVRSLLQAMQQQVPARIGRNLFLGDTQPNRPMVQSLSLSGRQVAAQLQPGDSRVCENKGYADLYTFQGRVGQPVMIDMTSRDFEGALVLLAPDGSLVGGDSSNAQQPIARILSTLPQNGTYTVVAMSQESGKRGQYQLQIGAPLVVRDDQLGVGDSPCADNNLPCRPYVFQGNPLETIQVQIVNAEFESLVVVTDSEGNVIGNSENSSNSVQVAIPANGIYKVFILGAQPHAHGRFLLTILNGDRTASISRN
jgi:S1-C subfamily serine protease